MIPAITMAMDCFREPFPKFFSGSNAETTIIALDVNPTTLALAVGGLTSDIILVPLNGQQTPIIALYDGVTSNLNWMKYYADSKNYIQALSFSPNGNYLLAHTETFACKLKTSL